MTKFREIAWLRIGAEGLVIVASILVAFSIDAWWDGRQFRDAEARQLARVAAELETNRVQIEEKLSRLEVAIDATGKLVSWLGPEPESVSQEEFGDTFLTLVDVGTFDVLTNALEDYLAAGRVELAFSDGLRAAVTDWYSRGDTFEGQYSLMREAHAELSGYVEDKVPTLHIFGRHPVMRGNLQSRFPMDHIALMSDPHFESRVATYLIRLEFLVSQAHDLLARQKTLVELIVSSTES